MSKNFFLNSTWLPVADEICRVWPILLKNNGIRYFEIYAIINTYHTIVHHAITLRTLRSVSGVIIMKRLK